MCWLSPAWFGAWLGPEGLGLHFCAGFTLSLMCANWLEARSGPEDLVPSLSGPLHLPSVHRDTHSYNDDLHPGTSFIPFKPCTRIGTPVLVVSVLELTSLLSECVYQSVHWQWLPLPWSEAGQASNLAPFPSRMHTLIDKGLSGEQCLGLRDWNRSPVQAGCHAGPILPSQPES